ncbi:hypothetical protein FRB90_005801, partial [Tulasnella sp. 427]
MRIALFLSVALAILLPATAAPSPRNPSRPLGLGDPAAAAGPNARRNPNVKRFGTNAEQFRAGLPPLPPKVRVAKVVKNRI